MRRHYSKKLKQEVEDRYVYDVIVAFGCVGCWKIVEIAQSYNIPDGTIRGWAYKRQWNKKRLKYLEALRIIETATIRLVEEKEGWDDSKWDVVNAVMNKIVKKRVLKPLVEKSDEILQDDVLDITPFIEFIKEYVKILDEHSLLGKGGLEQMSKLLVGDLKNALVTC